MSAMKQLKELTDYMLDDTGLAISHWGCIAKTDKGFVISDIYYPEDTVTLDQDEYIDTVIRFIDWYKGWHPNPDKFMQRFMEDFVSRPGCADYDASVLDAIAQYAVFGEIGYA